MFNFGFWNPNSGQNFFQWQSYNTKKHRSGIITSVRSFLRSLRSFSTNNEFHAQFLRVFCAVFESFSIP